MTRSRAGRILIIVQNMSVPQDRRVWQECQALVAAGHQVSVICPRGPGQARYLELEGVRIRTYAPPPATAGLPSYAFEFLFCWFRTLVLSVVVALREGFDVLQACNPPDTYFALAIPYRLLGKRFVYDQHDLCPEVYQSRFGRSGGLLLRGLYLLERLTYRTADHVISTNQSYRQVAIDRGRVDPTAITIVRSGPDPDRMRRGAPDPSLLRGRAHLCCWLGIMGPQDGVDGLLRSIHHLVHKLGREDVQFVLLGYGDSLVDLRAQCSDLGLDPWVTFTGPADLDLISRCLSTAAVGLSSDPLSPLNDVSTMNKTMEYMAYALPVVAYDLRETRVSAGEAAVYVSPNDELAYAEAISDLLDDPAARGRMGALGRQRIEGDLAWQRQVPGYVAAIESALGRTTASTRRRAPRSSSHNPKAEVT